MDRAMFLIHCATVNADCLHSLESNNGNIGVTASIV